MRNRVRLMGLEPAGDMDRSRGTETTPIEDGRIAEQWPVGDQLSPLRELGCSSRFFRDWALSNDSLVQTP